MECKLYDITYERRGDEYERVETPVGVVYAVGINTDAPYVYVETTDHSTSEVTAIKIDVRDAKATRIRHRRIQ